MESLEQGNILGHIVVLPANPLGDSDPVATGVLNNDPYPGWPRISVGAAVHVGNQLGLIPHCLRSNMSENSMRSQELFLVLFVWGMKRFPQFGNSFCTEFPPIPSN